MARNPQPWYRPSRKTWYVTIEGTLYNLGKDKGEAKKKFHELMSAPTKRHATTTVFAVMEEFLDWTQKHRAPDTYQFYKKRLKRFVAENKNMECSAFKPLHVQKWLDKKDWGETYKAGVVTTFRRCFNWASQQGYVDSNPVQFLAKPKAKHRDTPVTRNEYKTILKNTPITDPFYDLVVFSWESGCRPQESLHFTAANIDERNRRIVMENPKDRGPKWRVIHLNDKAFQIVQKHMQRHPEGPVFRNTDGKPWTPNACSNRFDRMRDKVGRMVALYDFRHAYGTDLLKSGVDPVTVAELMGHTDVKMLMETYQHVAQDNGYIRQQLAKRG